MEDYWSNFSSWRCSFILVLTRRITFRVVAPRDSGAQQLHKAPDGRIIVILYHNSNLFLAFLGIVGSKIMFSLCVWNVELFKIFCRVIPRKVFQNLDDHCFSHSILIQIILGLDLEAKNAIFNIMNYISIDTLGKSTQDS